MLKKLLFKLIFFCLLLNLSYAVVAQSPTPSPKSTPQKPAPTNEIDKKVQILKEKIATKVAQLEKEAKKVKYGEITKIAGDSFEIKTDKEENFKVTTDEFTTKFYSLTTGTKKEVDFKDLAKGDFVVISGTLIDNTINASLVYKDQNLTVDSGKLIGINSDDFSLNVETTDKSEYTLEVETSTKQQILDFKNLRLLPHGFSKLKEGDTVHFVGLKSKDAKGPKIVLLRLLTIPQEAFVKK